MTLGEIAFGITTSMGGVIFGYLLTIYEPKILFFSKKYNYIGEAHDINELKGIKKNPKTNRKGEYNFKRDFNRDKYVNYKYKNVVLKTRGKSISMTGTMYIENFTDKMLVVQIQGNGKFFEQRKDNGGFAHMVVRNKSKDVEWETVYVFRIKDLTKDIEGYWITENKANTGAFVFGDLHFKLTHKS